MGGQWTYEARVLSCGAIHLFRNYRTSFYKIPKLIYLFTFHVKGKVSGNKNVEMKVNIKIKQELDQYGTTLHPSPLRPPIMTFGICNCLSYKFRTYIAFLHGWYS